VFVVQLDAGSISLSCETGRMMFAPLTVCCFINPNSSGVSEPGFLRTRSSTPIFSHVVQQRRDAQFVQLGRESPNSWPISIEYLATRPE